MSLWKPLAGRIGLVATKPTSPGAVSALSLYKQTWGGEPANFQSSPNPLMPSAAQGIVSDLAATCSVALNRVDLSLTPSAQTGNPDPQPELRLIENSAPFFDELSRVAIAIGKNDIEIPPAFDRASAFVQFVSIEANVIEANQALVRTIPEKFRPQLTREESFVLQLSRPTLDRNGNIPINILTKWSVEQFQVVTFGIATGFHGGATPSAVMQPQLQVRAFLGACLSIDCSFPNDREPPDRGQQMESLFGCLSLIAGARHEYGLTIGELQYEKTIQ
jgi:hypothetical protein